MTRNGLSLDLRGIRLGLEDKRVDPMAANVVGVGNDLRAERVLNLHPLIAHRQEIAGLQRGSGPQGNVVRRDDGSSIALVIHGAVDTGKSDGGFRRGFDLVFHSGFIWMLLHAIAWFVYLS